MQAWIEVGWPYLSTALAIGLALAATSHVVLNKRDVSATIGWVGVIWLVPILGSLLYGLAGINRIRRRGVEVARDKVKARASERSASRSLGDAPARIGPLLCERGDEHLLELVQLGERISDRPLLDGNRVELLVDGDEAYPAMIAAIDAATRSVTLATYIFDHDSSGEAMIEALARAKARGIEVRVLIDDLGARYSMPPADRALRRRGVRAARFMRLRWPWDLTHFNLRSHRKLLIVDGRVGFTGGMNIREGHVLGRAPRHPIRDVHFRVEGPVVRELQEVFAEDWAFSTREQLEGEAYLPALDPCGEAWARVVSDGPDGDMDRIRWMLAGAMSAARHSIRIVTPYFLPDRSLLMALRVAALRGVQVDIVLPEHGNLALLRWAMWAHLSRFASPPCRFWLSPAPFDHAKLMLIDDHWSFVGSANWDTRSLRLNFELNLECYDPRLALELRALVDARLSASRPITQEELRRRPLWRRLRDGAAWLLSPYL